MEQASGLMLLQMKQPSTFGVQPALVDAEVEVEVEVDVEVVVEVDVDVEVDEDVLEDEEVDVETAAELPPTVVTVAEALTHSRPSTPVPLSSSPSGHSLTQLPSDR